MAQIESSGRPSHVVRARHLFCYVGREHSGAYLYEFSPLLGGRKPNTVTYSWAEVRTNLAHDVELRGMVAKIEGVMKAMGGAL